MSKYSRAHLHPDLTHSLASKSTWAQFASKNPRVDGLGYNPCCLRRDMSQQVANATTDYEVVSLLRDYTEITSFQRAYQGASAQGRMGVRTEGRYTMGGNAGFDFYNSRRSGILSPSRYG